MSNFYCEKCGVAILDTPGGSAITFCKHYPKKNWTGDFDNRFTRVSQGSEDKGKYRDDWFLKEAITAKEIKKFIEDLMIKILAEMEVVKTAREARHILKDYILEEK